MSTDGNTISETHAKAYHRRKKNIVRECFSDTNVKSSTISQSENNKTDSFSNINHHHHNNDEGKDNNNNNNLSPESIKDEKKKERKKRKGSQHLQSSDKKWGSSSHLEVSKAERKRSNSSTASNQIISSSALQDIKKSSEQKKRFQFLKPHKKEQSTSPGVAHKVPTPEQHISPFPGIPLKEVKEENAKVPFPGIPHHNASPPTIVVDDVSEKSDKASEKSVTIQSPKEKKRKAGVFSRLSRVSTTPLINLGDDNNSENGNNNNNNNNSSSNSNVPASLRSSSNLRLVVNSPKFESMDSKQVLLLRKFQNFLRTYNMQKLISNLGDTEMLKKRHEAITEFIKSEKTYFEILQIVVEGYITPLKAPVKPQSIPTIPNDDLNILFFNFEEIFHYHKTKVVQLTAQLAEQWPFFNIGKFLVDYFSRFLPLYERLASNITASEKLFERYSTKRNFKQFLETNSKIYQHTLAPTLKLLISYPSKHIMTYEALCKKILLNSHENSSQRVDLINAIATISQLRKYVKEQMEFEDLVLFSSLLENSAGKKVDLSAPKRNFIRDGNLLLSSSQKTAFLLSDLFVLTSKKPPNNFKIEESLSLKSLKISDVSMDDKNVFFTLEFPSSANQQRKKIEFCEATSKFDQSFTHSLEENARLCNDPIFGVSLQSLVDSERSSIPKIVMKAIYHLDKSQNKAGLFRNPGNPVLVTKIRLDEAEGRNDYNSIHVEDIATILLLYLDLLPDAVIPFDPTLPMFSGAIIPSEKAIIGYLEKVIKEMSECTRNLVEYILYYLQRLSSSGVFSTYELSLYFAPILIKPPIIQITIDYCTRITTILRIFDVLMRNSHIIFSSITASHNVPISILELFNSDSFGPWWKSFRSKDQSMAKFITSEESYKQLFTILLDPSEFNVPFSNLALHVLSTDWVADQLLSSPSLLDLYFSNFKHLDSEVSLKNLCELAYMLFSNRNCNNIIEYLLSDSSPACSYLVSQLGSGNVSNMFSKILNNLAKNQPEINQVLSKWGICCLDKLLITEYSYQSATLQNVTQFICDLLHSQHYVNSPYSSTFLHSLHILCETSNLFSKAISGDNPTSCCILIEMITAIITKKLTYPQSNDNENVALIREDAISSDQQSTVDRSRLELRKQASLSDAEDDDHTPIMINMSDNSGDANNNNLSNGNTAEDEENEADSDSDDENDEDVTSYVKPLVSSGGVKDVDLSATFLTRLMLQSKLIYDALKSPTPTFGPLKLSLLQLIRALVFINSPIINEVLPKTKLLDSCLYVFAFYSMNSIAQCIIRDIILFIIDNGDQALLSHLIQDTTLISFILSTSSKNPPPNSVCYKCHLDIIKNSLFKNEVCSGIIAQTGYDSEWKSLFLVKKWHYGFPKSGKKKNRNYSIFGVK